MNKKEEKNKREKRCVLLLPSSKARQLPDTFLPFDLLIFG